MTRAESIIHGGRDGDACPSPGTVGSQPYGEVLAVGGQHLYLEPSPKHVRLEGRHKP